MTTKLPAAKVENATTVPHTQAPPSPPSEPRARACGDSSPLISDALRDEAIQTLKESLRATKSLWSREADAFVAEPDFSTRTRAAELVLAYAEGRPVERTVRLNGDFSTYSEKLARLVSTPEGLRIAIAAGLVENPEKKANSGRGTSKTATIETETSEHSKSQIAQSTHGQVVDVGSIS